MTVRLGGWTRYGLFRNIYRFEMWMEDRGTRNRPEIDRQAFRVDRSCHRESDILLRRRTADEIRLRRARRYSHHRKCSPIGSSFWNEYIRLRRVYTDISKVPPFPSFYLWSTLLCNLHILRSCRGHHDQELCKTSRIRKMLVKSRQVSKQANFARIF